VTGRRTDLSGGGRTRFSRGASMTRGERGDLGAAKLVNDEDHSLLQKGLTGCRLYIFRSGGSSFLLLGGW